MACRIIPLAFATLAMCADAFAACDDFSSVLGYTIIHVGNVTGYINKDGEKVDDFEGCEWDRILIIDYNKSVRCTGYGYSYTYNPEIVIFQRGPLAKACIDGEWYDISLQ